VPHNINNTGRLEWLDEVIGRIRKYENALINKHPAPPAYIFVTNYPFLYNLDSFGFSRAAVAEGFKIPDFKVDTAFSNLRDALKSRENHIDMLDLIKAMKEYEQIPNTFDGEIPEYAFGEIQEPRLKIGNKYIISDASGKEVVGILEDAVVSENERKVHGSYRLENGERIWNTCPLSEKEFKVFKEYPDTFFGVYKKHSNQARDALELYDFFLGVYKSSSKEKLLEFLQGSSDYDMLKGKTQEELATIYCERLVYSAYTPKNSKGTVKGDKTNKS
jgi:hypothetical protein